MRSLKTLTLLLCAGDNRRFNGFPKWMLEIEGETLLGRTLRMCGFDIQCVVTLEEAARRGNAPYVLPVKEHGCTAETLLSTSPAWPGHDRVVVLLGDVFYTDECMMIIRGNRDRICYFTDGLETFAISFVESAFWDMEKHLRSTVRINGGNPDGGRLNSVWSLLHSGGCRPVKVLIGDRTQDFDTPQDHEDFLAGRSKNRNQNNR